MSQVLEKVVNKEEVELDARSDTWMYGVMLLQLFCPELPPYSEVRYNVPCLSQRYFLWVYH